MGTDTLETTKLAQKARQTYNKLKEDVVKKFKEMTIAQDQYRKMSIKDFHPILAEFIYER